LIDRDAEDVSDDKCGDRVGAGSNVLSAAFDADMTARVVAQPYLGALPGRHRVQGGAHAVADQPAVLAHRADRGVALLPADHLGAARVALLEGLACPRRARARIDVGVVAEADLDRVEVKFERELVECRLEREQAGRLSDAAHEVRHHRAGRREPIAGVDVVAGVEQRCRGARTLGEVVDHRGRAELVMANRRQLSVASRAQRDVLPLLFAVAGRRRHLVARDHELHRPVELARGEHRERRVEPEGSLRAERTANEATDDADILRLEVEQIAEVELDHRDPLRGLVNRHL
jgi:hypothetical protein